MDAIGHTPVRRGKARGRYSLNSSSATWIIPGRSSSSKTVTSVRNGAGLHGFGPREVTYGGMPRDPLRLKRGLSNEETAETEQGE